MDVGTSSSGADFRLLAHYPGRFSGGERLRDMSKSEVHKLILLLSSSEEVWVTSLSAACSQQSSVPRLSLLERFSSR